MESIHRPSPSSSPFPSFFSNNPTQPRRKHLHFHTKQRQPLPSQFLLQTRALDNALSTAVANSTTASSTGELSVLIPISTILFFIYWIANFVVPDMMTKDFQRNASDEEETPELQANNSATKESQKIKKRTAKKMTTP